ncbi:MAG: hypothetical protein MJ154_00690 [Candidatus Saccharibacteria bacterium]|nr:hypothetical protein [Candidatus Saccharibacteria bacterium]
MAFGKCAHCGTVTYLNHNDLCNNCATYPGNNNPSPKWGTCTKCGKMAEVNVNGVCSSCNTGSKKGWW